MRKAKQLRVLGCAIAAVLGTSRIASANVLIYEPFNYTAGQPITGQNNNFSATDEIWQLASAPGKDAGHTVGSGGLSATQAMIDAGYYPPLGNDADLKKTGTTA